MVVLGQAAQEAAILGALDPSGSIEGGGLSIRLGSSPGVRSVDGRIVWRDLRWGERERAWFEARGAGLVTVLDVMPGDWVSVDA